MPSKYMKYLLLNVIAIIIFASTAALSEPLKCSGPYLGKTISQKQLLFLLSKRTEKSSQLNLCGATLKNISLNNANLSNINFSQSDLSNAILIGADFSNDNLTKTFFLHANLSKSNFQHALMQEAVLKYANLNASDLRWVNFYHADLSHASLKLANLMLSILNHANLSFSDLSNADGRWADFSFADLSDANLTNAYFENANFSSAGLKNTTINNTNFEEANFNELVYEPNLNGLPNLITFHTVKNFQNVKFVDFNNSKAALAELRNSYKKLNIRSMERVITSIIKHHEMTENWKRGGFSAFEAIFNYVFFYLTCHFGANPSRPLVILILFILIFAIPYRYALFRPTKHNSIVVIWKPSRFVKWTKTHVSLEPEKNYSKILKENNTKTNLIAYQAHLFLIALFFSSLSAFSIGWKQINVSNWLSHLQSREYTLKGKGWVRILSGFQSILSAFLIILWVLIYFASPFEW